MLSVLSQKYKIISLLTVIAFLSVAGCSNQANDKIARLTKGNITKVAMMYKMFSSAHNFMGPANEAEFKEWVQGEDAVKKQLERFGVDPAKFDEYMISENSGEKFEIRWSVKSRPMAPPYPVAYDETAVDGVRQVGMAGGKTLDVDDDELYEELKKGEYNPDDFE